MASLFVFKNLLEETYAKNSYKICCCCFSSSRRCIKYGFVINVMPDITLVHSCRTLPPLGRGLHGLLANPGLLLTGLSIQIYQQRTAVGVGACVCRQPLNGQHLRCATSDSEAFGERAPLPPTHNYDVVIVSLLLATNSYCDRKEPKVVNENLECVNATVFLTYQFVGKKYLVLLHMQQMSPDGCQQQMRFAWKFNQTLGHLAI
ncbi:hypothetical protein EVAR_87684_1 [Eumeta japonica]|uniref:Uncharacterized protein n=1 Tax=Eumeta variegata TaxID=151549 RepID=A0A4C1XN78_EUMVA|nr:hypothetical protein EVAR_87684_1 [Eumeta japonica]